MIDYATQAFILSMFCLHKWVMVDCPNSIFRWKNIVSLHVVVLGIA